MQQRRRQEQAQPPISVFDASSIQLIAGSLKAASTSFRSLSGPTINPNSASKKILEWIYPQTHPYAGVDTTEYLGYISLKSDPQALDHFYQLVHSKPRFNKPPTTSKSLDTHLFCTNTPQIVSPLNCT
jgi:hypothetical protein